MNLERHNLGLGQKPALIVVDMINGFTDPACPLGCECPEVVAANAVILDAFHRRSLPVYFTTVVYHDAAEAQIFRQRLPALNVLTPGSRWVAIDPRLPREPQDEVVEKRWASAFHATDLDRRLRRLGVDSLVITGLTTSGCVRATAVDGLQYDYRVMIPREAVGDRNSRAHEANLFDLDAKYADVSALTDVIAALPGIDAR